MTAGDERGWPGTPTPTVGYGRPPTYGPPPAIPEPRYAPGPPYEQPPQPPQPPYQPPHQPRYEQRYAPAPALSPPGPHPSAHPLGHPPAHPPAVPPRRRSWARGLTLAVVALLAAGLVYQTVRIQRLTDRLAGVEKVLVEGQARDGARLDGLDGRAGELEKKLGSTFDPEAISAAALPSVFRVNAGEVTGTAFAVGKPASGGGTHLFTNWHVVEELWNGGGRKVTLERADDSFPATIVKVDKDNDVAQLKTASKFAGLATAEGDPKSGQQIVVVGAPLGLTDSVTTGVVSAVRKMPDTDGPMIQFSAPINPGNSGGPVINAAKQVVGIATAKARDAEGIGLAVPITVACAEFTVC
jgi:putative serine protease PepD